MKIDLLMKNEYLPPRNIPAIRYLEDLTMLPNNLQLIIHVQLTSFNQNPVNWNFRK